MQANQFINYCALLINERENALIANPGENAEEAKKTHDELSGIPTARKFVQRMKFDPIPELLDRLATIPDPVDNPIKQLHVEINTRYVDGGCVTCTFDPFIPVDLFPYRSLFHELEKCIPQLIHALVGIDMVTEVAMDDTCSDRIKQAISDAGYQVLEHVVIRAIRKHTAERFKIVFNFTHYDND